MLPTSLTGFEDQTRFFLSDRLFDNRRRLARGPQLDAAGQPLLWALSAVVLAACGTSGGGPASLLPVPQSLRPAGEGTDFLYTGPADPLRQGKADGRGGDDHLVFVAHDSILAGGSGDDMLILRGAENRVWGGAGQDLISGGDGAERLDGGAGRDILTGGLGGDVFVLAVAASTMLGADVITDFGFSAQDRPPMPDALEFADNTKTVWIRGNTHAATGRLRDDGNDPSPNEGTDTVLYADAAGSRILGVLEDWDMGATELARHLTDSSIQIVEIA